MVKPPHAEEINYCIVSFSDYEKFNKFTNSTENVKEAKKSQPELDYKDDILKPMKDLKLDKNMYGSWEHIPC
jgi:hypothetical protein